MAFQPFGYPFDLSSTASVSDAKVAIRKRWKSWFSMPNGARGWMVGPVICLWHEANSTHGPMLLGWISPDGSGTRIRGRAGSDLNGTIAMAFYMPFLIAVGCLLVVGGDVRPGALVLAMAVVLGPLGFWMAHRNRKEAEPLVQFLEGSLAACGRMRRHQPIVSR
jgi:hypothetical protein